MIKKTILLVITLLILTGCGIDREQRLLNQIEKILKLPDSEIDIAKAKLTIDKVIDHSIDIKANLKKIEALVIDVKRFAGDEKVTTTNISNFLYKKSIWNNYQIYDYDNNSSISTNMTASLLPNYLETKIGNCVSMPVLHFLIASRLGFDVYLSHTPGHILIKIKYPNGSIKNIEATDFGCIKEDEYYIKLMAISNLAVKNKLYLQPLTNKEAVSVLLTKLLTFYFESKDYEKALYICDLCLKYYPNLVMAIINKAQVFSKMYYREIDLAKKQERKPNSDYLKWLDQQYGIYSKKAKDLGYTKPPKSYTEELLEMLINSLRKARERKRKNTNNL